MCHKHGKHKQDESTHISHTTMNDSNISGESHRDPQSTSHTTSSSSSSSHRSRLSVYNLFIIFVATTTTTTTSPSSRLALASPLPGALTIPITTLRQEPRNPYRHATFLTSNRKSAPRREIVSHPPARPHGGYAQLSVIAVLIEHLL